MIIFIALLSALSISDAQPAEDFSIQNVITVPPNCPTGQEWVNGQCREVWRNGVNPANVVTVPPNCLTGQVFVNGQCRDVWFKSLRAQLTRNPEQIGIMQPQYGEHIWRSDAVPANVVTVPPNCPVGQEYVNGQCREIWVRKSNQLQMIYDNSYQTQQVSNAEETLPTLEDRNVISVPNQCPVGYKPDALGFCREILPVYIAI